MNEAEFKIDDDLLLELNAKIDTMSKDQYPKLQITQKNGVFIFPVSLLAIECDLHLHL